MSINISENKDGADLPLRLPFAVKIARTRVFTTCSSNLYRYQTASIATKVRTPILAVVASNIKVTFLSIFNLLTINCSRNMGKYPIE